MGSHVVLFKNNSVPLQLLSFKNWISLKKTWFFLHSRYNNELIWKVTLQNTGKWKVLLTYLYSALNSYQSSLSSCDGKMEKKFLGVLDSSSLMCSSVPPAHQTLIQLYYYFQGQLFFVCLLWASHCSCVWSVCSVSADLNYNPRWWNTCEVCFNRSKERKQLICVSVCLAWNYLHQGVSGLKAFVCMSFCL